MNKKLKFWLDVIFRYLMPASLFGYLVVKEMVRLRGIGYDPKSDCSAADMAIISFFLQILLWLYLSTVEAKFGGKLGTVIVLLALIFAGILVWLFH